MMKVLVGAETKGPNGSLLCLECGQFDTSLDEVNPVEGQSIDLFAKSLQLKLPESLPGTGTLTIQPAGLGSMTVELKLENVEDKIGVKWLKLPQPIQNLPELVLPDRTEAKAILGNAKLITSPAGWVIKSEAPEGLIEYCGIQFALDSKAGVRIGAGGLLSAKANAVPKPITLGGKLLSNVKVLSGQLEVVGRAIQASVTVSFVLAAFNDICGEMDIHLSRGPESGSSWLATAQTRVQSAKNDSNPNRFIRFSEVGVVLDCSADDSRLTVVNPRLSGRVSFEARNLSGAAAEWLQELFSGSELVIHEATFTLEEEMPSITVQLLESFRIRALGVLDLEIPAFTLKEDKVELKDLGVHTDLGVGVLSGRLSSLTFDMEKKELSMGEAAPAIDLTLSSPGGIKATARLAYADQDEEKYLIGVGLFSSPAFPALGIRFRLGRSRSAQGDNWVPNVLLLAEGDIDIPLFTGVVIRNLSLGFGINMEVDGTSGLSLQDALRKVREGLPDIRDPAVWKPARESKNLLTLIAAAKISASKLGKNIPDLYAGDLAILVSSNAQWAIIGKFWLLTSVDKIGEPRFATAPLVSALVLLDGQAPSLRAAAVTMPNSATEAVGTGPLSLAISSFPSMRFALEATPSNLTVAIGPNTLSGKIGSLQVEGSRLLALHVSKGKRFAVSSSSIRAAFKESSKLDLGPAHFRISASFGFSCESTMIGILEDGRLLLYASVPIQAHASIELNVQIRFEIRKKVFRKTFVVSWSQSWNFNLAVYSQFTLDIAADSKGDAAIEGIANVTVNVLGIEATVSLPVLAGRSSLLTEAKGSSAKVQRLLAGA